MTAAAIAVGSGVLFLVTAQLHIVVVSLIPMLYGALLGLYFLPGAIAQFLLKIPGIALIVALLAGLFATLSPVGVNGLVGVLVIGTVQEIPFLLTLYRKWSPWLNYVGALVAGMFFAVGFHFAFRISDYGLEVQIMQALFTTLSPVLMTFLGQLVAQGLQKSGITTRRELPLGS